MQNAILPLLQASLSLKQAQLDLNAALRDVTGTNAMAGDVIHQLTRQEPAHREFSLFTPRDGRP